MEHTIKIMMYSIPTDISRNLIKDIKNGKALTDVNRWFDIICDCLEVKDYETVPDSEADSGKGYIVCNECNKTHYLSDLRDQQQIPDLTDWHEKE